MILSNTESWIIIIMLHPEVKAVQDTNVSQRFVERLQKKWESEATTVEDW